jgi:hypothetical protein
MSIVSVGTIQSNTSSPVIFTNSSSTEIGTLCRAFCNFNGTTVTNPASMTGVRASFNIASILDNGTGDYTINFTNAFSDANYAISAATNTDCFAVTTLTTSSFKLLTFNRRDVFLAEDAATACVSVFR